MQRLEEGGTTSFEDLWWTFGKYGDVVPEDLSDPKWADATPYAEWILTKGELRYLLDVAGRHTEELPWQMKGFEAAIPYAPETLPELLSWEEVEPK